MTSGKCTVSRQVQGACGRRCRDSLVGSSGCRWVLLAHAPPPSVVKNVRVALSHAKGRHTLRISSEMGHRRNLRSLDHVTSWNSRSSTRRLVRTCATTPRTRLTILKITPTPRPPHKLLDPLPRTFEPRDWLRRVSLLDLTPPPDTQRMIAALRERKRSTTKGEVTGSPDGILRVDGELRSAWCSN